MLLGYRPDTGEIEFLFSDTDYLERQFPDNTAMISDFWKCEHGLKELFVDSKQFPDCLNYKKYKVVGGKLVLKPESAVRPVKRVDVKSTSVSTYNLTDIKSLEEEVKRLQLQIEKLKEAKK